MIDLYAEQSDRFIGTTAAIISAIGMGAAAGASVYGAHKQAESADTAAKLQVDAANHAADVKAQSDREALDFQKQQAETQWQNDEGNRHANYDQWAAKRRNIGSIGTMLGLGGGGDIPAYVPSTDPRFGASGGPAPPPAGPGGPPPGAPAPRRPANFDAAVNGPALPAPPIDPRLMGGNGGVVAPMGTPQLQPDGTYAIPSSMPRYRTFGQSMGVA